MPVLSTPAQLDPSTALHEEELEPVPEVDVGGLLGPRDRTGPPPSSARGLMVSIGHPQSWSLIELFQQSGQDLPPEIKLQTDQAGFCMVRLACSFRPHPGVRVAWARFSAYLHGPGGKASPIAFDIHPKEIFDESERHAQVAITPQFKFGQLQADLGSAKVGIEYHKLEPVIIGAGALQADPSWTFERTRGHEVIGVKFMHLIVKHRRGEQGVRASFEVIAEVSKPGQYLWLVRTREQDSLHRTAVICTT